MATPADIPIIEEGPPLRVPPLKVRLASSLAVGAISLIGRSWRIRVEGEEILEENLKKGCIVAFWHGRALIPVWKYRGRGVAVMVSFHSDGEIMNRSLARLGYRRVRGSTTTGGRAALSAMSRLLKDNKYSTALTPDGPKGPSHEVQPGVLILASKTGKPIIPCGIGARSRWELNSWDRYLIPKPFTRARMVVGEPIYAPPNMRRPALEELSSQLRTELNRLECQADDFSNK